MSPQGFANSWHADGSAVVRVIPKSTAPRFTGNLPRAKRFRGPFDPNAPWLSFAVSHDRLRVLVEIDSISFIVRHEPMRNLGKSRKMRRLDKFAITAIATTTPNKCSIQELRLVKESIDSNRLETFDGHIEFFVSPAVAVRDALGARYKHGGPAADRVHDAVKLLAFPVERNA